MRNINEVSVKEYFIILKKHIVIIALVALISLSYSFYNVRKNNNNATSSYRSTSQILITGNKSYNVSSKQTTMETAPLTTATYIDIINSSSVINGVDVSESEKGKIKPNMKAEATLYSNVITISFTGSSIENAVDVNRKLIESLTKVLKDSSGVERISIITEPYHTATFSSRKDSSEVILTVVASTLVTYMICAIHFYMKKVK